MAALETQIAGWLAQGEDLVLVTVLGTEGSAPRAAGARMVLRAGGETAGTVGGGRVEAAVMEIASGLFRERRAVIQTFALDSQGSLGMVCGGRMTVLVELLPASPENLALFRYLAFPDQDPRSSRVVAALGSALEGSRPRIERLRVDAGASGVGPLAALAGKLAQRTYRQRHPLVAQEDGQWFLLEPLFSWGTVYLFGAGHVGLATEALAKVAGFRTVVVDDRPDFANRRRFDTADDVRAIESFERALEGLDVGGDSYLVILTRGHQHDQTVLEQALRTPARYVGMIGSRKKRNAIFESLREKGFAPEQIQRVRCPIGLEIHAETPEEIAVSIVAELIAERNSPGAGC